MEVFMEVILYEDVPDLGFAGDIVNVSDGYARNYLLPRKIAAIADKSKIAELEHKKRVAEAKKAKLKAAAEDLAAKLNNISVTISAEAGEGDKLFGSVTSANISAALREMGYAVDKRHIKLQEPIKKIGVYDIMIHLHPEVNASLKVWVVRK